MDEPLRDRAWWERVVRVLCAETPDVALERRRAPIVFRDESGTVCLQVHVLVALETETEPACARFLERLRGAFHRLPDPPVGDIELCVTGRYPRSPIHRIPHNRIH